METSSVSIDSRTSGFFAEITERRPTDAARTAIAIFRRTAASRSTPATLAIVGPGSTSANSRASSSCEPSRSAAASRRPLHQPHERAVDAPRGVFRTVHLRIRSCRSLNERAGCLQIWKICGSSKQSRTEHGCSSLLFLHAIERADFGHPGAAGSCFSASTGGLWRSRTRLSAAYRRASS